MYTHLPPNIGNMEIHTHTHTCVCVCVCVYKHIHNYIYIPTCIQICLPHGEYANTLTHKHTHTHTHTHTHMYTHIYTYMYTDLPPNTGILEIRLDEQQRQVVVTAKGGPLKAGGEVYVSYGNYGNTQLLVQYGAHSVKPSQCTFGEVVYVS